MMQKNKKACECVCVCTQMSQLCSLNAPQANEPKYGGPGSNSAADKVGVNCKS